MIHCRSWIWERAKDYHSGRGPSAKADGQTFEDICAPQLYKDCLISDVNKFLYGPEMNADSQKRKLLSEVHTLRIYLSPNRDDASYFDLMLGKARWEDIGCARQIIPGITSEFVDIAAFDYVQNEIAGYRLRQASEVQSESYKSFKRVSMSAAGDQSWGTHSEHHIIDQYFQVAWLPTILLSLPSVDHYCQSSMLGPLAITNTLYIPTHPPKIATFHASHRWTIYDLSRLPPIAKGSINRYMTPHPMIVHSSDPGDLTMTGWLRSAFHPLQKMLECSKPVLVREGDQVETASMATSMTAGTTIEVYNYIQLGWGRNSSNDLAKLQKALDTLAGPWEGKVFLKEREDCPPCSACGFEYPKDQ